MSVNKSNLYTRPAISNNALLADQRITVAGSVVAAGSGFTAYDQTYVDTVEWDVQDADVMVTFDGSDPSSSNGHRLYQGNKGTWSRARFNAARFIRQGSTSAAIQVSPSAI